MVSSEPVDVGPVTRQFLTRADGFFGGPDHLTFRDKFIRGQVSERAVLAGLIIVEPQGLGPRPSRWIGVRSNIRLAVGRSTIHWRRCPPVCPAERSRVVRLGERPNPRVRVWRATNILNSENEAENRIS